MMRNNFYVMSFSISVVSPLLVLLRGLIMILLLSLGSTFSMEEIYLLRKSSLNSSRLFSFVHISKCAGSAWIQELQTYLSFDRVFPKALAGAEFSVHEQENLVSKILSKGDQDEPHYKLISLKSPRHHVWSMFTECKYDKWGKKVTNGTSFPRSGSDEQHDEKDFNAWLDHFLIRTSLNDHTLETLSFPTTDIDDYNCYHPANFQSRALTSIITKPHHVEFAQGNHEPIFEPNVSLALETYWNHDWVGLADFFHESKCLLLHRLTPNGNSMTWLSIQEYLNSTCRCDDTSNQSILAPDAKVIHHQEGHRASLLNLNLDIRSKVDGLTRTDVHVYKVALLEFLREIVWLESHDALGRRIICENVLEKMDSELSYLNMSIIHQYHLLQQQYVENEMEDE